MKKIFYTTILLFLLTTIWGMSKKNTYTDILNNQDNHNPEVYVAGISGEMAIEACEKMRKDLSAAALVVKVKGKEKTEYFGRTARQLVEVVEVLKGEGLLQGEEVYLTGEHWSLITYASPYSMERGFVNECKRDKEYLVFLQREIEFINETVPIYELYTTTLISPVFSCEEHINIIPQPVGGTTYMKYGDVKDNEFFSVDEKGVRVFLELKKEIFKQYGISVT